MFLLQVFSSSSLMFRLIVLKVYPFQCSIIKKTRGTLLFALFYLASKALFFLCPLSTNQPNLSLFSNMIISVRLVAFPLAFPTFKNATPLAFLLIPDSEMSCFFSNSLSFKSSLDFCLFMNSLPSVLTCSILCSQKFL